MILAGAIIGIPLTTAGILWALTRRRAPALSMPKNSKLKLQERLDDPEERAALKEAFMSGPDFRWIATGSTKPQTKELEQWKEEVANYMLECQLRYAEKYGYILVSRDEKTGEFLGQIALLPPIYFGSDNPSWRRVMQFLSSVVSQGKPIVENDPESNKRFLAFNHGVEQMANKAGPHWYVALIGVSNAAKGKGVGRRLMEEAMNIMGDEYPIMFECHTGNVGFYEKLGFSECDKVEFGEDQSDQLTFHMMSRPART